jgi:hypothetical protein
MAYAPNPVSGSQPPRVAPVEKATATVDRAGMNSLLAQITMASSPARGGRVTPQSVVAVSENRIAPTRFETPKVESGGFTGSAIRPIGQGFKSND